MSFNTKLSKMCSARDEAQSGYSSTNGEISTHADKESYMAFEQINH